VYRRLTLGCGHHERSTILVSRIGRNSAVLVGGEPGHVYVEAFANPINVLNAGEQSHIVLTSCGMQAIGHSFLPPYWALGFHQARFGFTRNMSILEQTLEGFINNSIPLQVKCLFVTLFVTNY
jgi:hypothetical protein